MATSSMRMDAKDRGNTKRSHPTLWTSAPGGGSLSDERSRGRERYQAAVTRRWGTVRVLVVVLLGLVVVLAALTEVCLLQAASMRRRIRAVLPPEDGEDR
jgi:hypothetical protein